MKHNFLILSPERRHSAFRGKCALAVMAKAPYPGMVKTRLSPPLTPEQAATLNASFLRDTVENLELVSQKLPARWVISYTPQGEEVAFQGILPEAALLLPQRGDGFGERLLHTAEDLFRCGFDSVCLIDSDSPTVPTSAYVHAVEGLISGEDRVALGPARDGGYYLIGMQQPHSLLFERINWSSEVVASQTQQRAAEIGLRVDLLETWYDVDDAESLYRLHSEFFGPDSGKGRGYSAPHTRTYLSGLRNGTKESVLFEVEK